MSSLFLPNTLFTGSMDLTDQLSSVGLAVGTNQTLANTTTEVDQDTPLSSQIENTFASTPVTTTSLSRASRLGNRDIITTVNKDFDLQIQYGENSNTLSPLGQLENVQTHIRNTHASPQTSVAGNNVINTHFSHRALVANGTPSQVSTLQEMVVAISSKFTNVEKTIAKLSGQESKVKSEIASGLSLLKLILFQNSSISSTDFRRITGHFSITSKIILTKKIKAFENNMKNKVKKLFKKQVKANVRRMS